MGVADVAPDAFADVAGAAFVDLSRQEGVGDGWSRCTDQVLLPGPQRLRHGVGRCIAPHRHHWPVGQGLGVGDAVAEVAFLHEPARAHFDAVIRHREVPQVGQVSEQAEGVVGLRLIERDAEPRRHGGTVADRLARVLDQLAHDPHPVLQRPAIFIAAVVHAGVEKLGEQIAVGGVDVDDVEARLDRPQRSVAVPAAEVADILLIDLAGLAGVVDPAVGLGSVAQAVGGKPRREVHDHTATEPQLDPGQGTVLVHRVGHQPVGADIFIVPERGIGKGLVVRGWVDRAEFGVDHAPAAFGLDPAHGGEHLRSAPAHAGAVRHLIETVLGGDRSDADGVEQNIVPRVSHGLSLCHCRLCHPRLCLPTGAAIRIIHPAFARTPPARSGHSIRDVIN